MTVPQPQNDSRRRRGRSAVTNGKKLKGTDGRSAHVKRFRDLVEALTDELGGEQGSSEGRRAIVRQAAAVIVASEAMQARILRGEAVDVEELSRVSNVLARLFHSIGAKRPAAADKTPSLAAYLDGRSA